MHIQIHGGAVALVDDDAPPFITSLKWRLNGSADSPSGVVSGHHRNGTFVLLHRLVVGARPGQVVDHINGDVLDNRRCNLRACTHAQNMRNRRRSKNNKSGFKGVYLEGGGYRAQITVDGTKFRLGLFGTAERAHQAYVRAAKLFHGEFARFN